MIVATEAVVLHSRKQGDTSKIVALYTRDFGLIDVIAKGARQQRSKFAGALELFSSSKIVFYKKEHQELYLLSTAEIVASRRHISDDLERIEAATRIAELLIRSQHHEESHPELFELVTTTLDAIDSSDNTERLQSLRFWFFLKYAEFTGFALRYDREAEDRIVFDASRGTFEFSEQGVESDHARYIAVTPEMLGVLRYMETATLGSVTTLRLSPQCIHGLSAFFAAYFAWHLEGMNRRVSRSDQVFSAMATKRN